MKYRALISCSVACMLLVVGCSKATDASGSGASNPMASADKGAGQAPAYKMTLHKVMDTEGTGKLACTYLLPDGWTAQDQLKWMPNSYLTPVIGSSILKSQDGTEQIDTLSGMQFNFSHGPTGNTGMEAPKKVSDFLLGLWKKDHAGVKFEIVSKEDVPIDTSSTPPPPGGSTYYANRGSFKLKFQVNGQTYLAKSQARIDVMRTPTMASGIGGDMYEGGWVLGSAFDVTAPEDKFEDALKLCGIVLTSVRTDPHFYNTVLQAQQIIQQNFYNQQRQIMETSRIISETNDQISDMIMSSYHTSQAAQDKEVTAFDNYIRGEDEYKTSDGPINLPSGYAHAFADDAGHYIVTDSHGYDPNVNGPGGSWHELRKSQ